MLQLICYKRDAIGRNGSWPRTVVGAVTDYATQLGVAYLGFFHLQE